MPHRTLSRHVVALATATALAALVQAQEATAQPVEERTFYNGLECTPWPLYDIHDTERLRRLGRTEQSYVNAEGYAWWRNTPGSLFCPITRRTTASDQFDVSDIQSVLYYTGDLGGPADDYEARLCLTPYDPNQGSRCGAVNKPGLLGTRPNTYGLGIAAPPKTILGTYFAITAYLNVRRPSGVQRGEGGGGPPPPLLELLPQGRRAPPDRPAPGGPAAGPPRDGRESEGEIDRRPLPN